MTEERIHPVAIIGGGPIGLAVASSLTIREVPVVILEQGKSAGASVAQWGHVPLFTPWSMNISDPSKQILQTGCWESPDPQTYPTGRELCAKHLKPLSRALPSQVLRLQHKVIGISRGSDKRSSARRGQFVLVVRTPEKECAMEAQFVVDASGTYGTPNPLGSSGLLVPGEKLNSKLIHYRIPHLIPRLSAGSSSLKVAVVGSGDSALNAIAFLAKRRRVHWLIRGSYLPPSASKYQQKQQLAEHVLELVAEGRVKVEFDFKVQRVENSGSGVRLLSENTFVKVDQVYALTGFRPDLGLTRELCLKLDSAIECNAEMREQLQPCGCSCDSPMRFGPEQLEHGSEPGFFTIGSKSFGRATDFFLQLGFQQAEVVANVIVGRLAIARTKAARVG